MARSSQIQGMLFSTKVFDTLPPVVQELLAPFETDKEKTIVTFSSLVSVSAALPKYYVNYYRGYGSNLFGTIVGKAGSGKSLMSYSAILVQGIHEQRKMEYAAAMEEFHQSEDEHKQEPKERLFIIPADSSFPKLIELLLTSPDGAIMIEPELDTMTDAMKREDGKHSTIFRKVVEHEPVSYSTKSGKTIEVYNSCLSFLLSGTPKQLGRLIGDMENGLFSRISFLAVDADNAFRLMFDFNDDKKREKFQEVSEAVTDCYNKMKRNKPVELEFTQVQKMILQKRFSVIFNMFNEDPEEEDFNGVVFRLVVMLIRFIMVISVLSRHKKINGGWVAPNLPEKIVCTNRDFVCGFRMLPALLNGMVNAAMLVSGRINKMDLLEKLFPNAQERAKAIELHEAGKSHKEIAIEVLNDPKGRRKIGKWLEDERFKAALKYFRDDA